MSCRLHGPRCRTPWGYDPAHTDSARPYTDAELAARAEAPHRYAYGPIEDYYFGFYLWRAFRRDDRPTWDEMQAKLEVMADALGVPSEVINA
ncbi:hypothetical protein F4561_002696 [Lipingzhangella halophila]|uniref:Uncharacterized protein n=1 Tax=Lipingzhangella halophila TaxID=1783352 RepID=A0A7W7W2K9_9ACTN|nr:hypothetical protein [Lipingzhangella halophila]MBB4931876.1 hypothetical protein [Lipingzhangella halophila]